MELLFPRLVLQSAFAHLDAAHGANWFLIPQYTTCYYHSCLWKFPGNHTTDECKQMTGDYLAEILDKVERNYPFFRQSAGANHLLVFPWDQASEIVGWSHPVRDRIKNAVHLTTLGSVVPYENFNPHKDIVIPPFTNFSQALELHPDPFSWPCSSPLNTFKWRDAVSWNIQQWADLKDAGVAYLLHSVLGSNEKSKSCRCKWHSRPRGTFAYFRGTILDDFKYSQGVRQYLKVLGDNLPKKYHIHNEHSKKYWLEVGDSVYSLCPSGWSSWSPRLFDSIMTASIPVIFADGIQLPFEALVDYRSFAVKIANAKVDTMDSQLSDISAEEIAEKRRNMIRIRHKFIWNSPPQTGDAFYSTMELLSRKTSPNKPVGLDEF